MLDYVVEAKSINKKFKQPNGDMVHALQDVTIRIKPKGITAIIGPDGAGKTTFMRLLCGLMQPDEGQLSVLGLSAREEATTIQSLLGYMPQKFGLYEDLTVMENMNLYGKLHEVPLDVQQERCARLLAMTGLSPFTERLAGKLSGGMKQKLGLACTLIRTPQLLLLDEPTVGVDPLSRRELWHILHQLVAEENLTVVVNTGYMDEASESDYVYIMHEGHILAEGSPTDLLQYSVGKTFTVDVPSDMKARIVQSLLLNDDHFVYDAVPDGNTVRCVLKNEDVIPQLSIQKRQETFTFTAVPPTLEDSFMLLLGQASKAVAWQQKPAYTVMPPASTEPHIVVDHLLKKFGDFTAVNETTFTVHKGEIFGLLGPNGAGKSTTFRMLCGLLKPTDGFLSVAGVDVRESRAEARQNLGYVAQKFSLYGTLSIKENLEFFGGVYGLSKRYLRQRIPEIMDEFHLTAKQNTLANDLSLGYKQRLSMAAALMHKPSILFLDEPTSGIDPLARRQFWRRITDLAYHGTTVVVTTHFMEEAEYCDRMMIQDQGRMIAIGTPADIRQQGDHARTMNEAFIHIVEQGRRHDIHES